MVFFVGVWRGLRLCYGLEVVYRQRKDDMLQTSTTVGKVRSKRGGEMNDSAGGEKSRMAIGRVCGFTSRVLIHCASKCTEKMRPDRHGYVFH